MAVVTNMGIVLYDASTLSEVWFNANGVTAWPVFSPDSSLLAMVMRDTSIRMVRVSDGMEVSRLQSPGTTITTPSATAFSADGLLLASGVSTGAFRIWRVADATLVQESGGFDSPITQLRFANESATPAIADSGLVEPGSKKMPMKIRLWSVTEGTASQTISPATDIYPVGLGNGATTLLGISGGQLQAWSVPGLVLLKTLDTNVNGLGVDLNYGMFSQDGSLFAMAMRSSPGINIWNVDDLTPRPIFPGNALGASTVVLSPDKLSVAAAFQSGLIRIWPLIS